MTRPPPLRAGWAFWPWAALLVLAPLPLGGGRPWAISLMQGWLGLALMLWAAARLRRPDHPPAVPLAPLAVPAAMILAALLWGVLQTLAPAPWPLSLLEHPLWGQTAAILGQSLAGAVAVNPDAALEELSRHLLTLGVFFLALRWGASQRRAEQVIVSLALAGGLLACYGLWALWLGGDQILGMPKSAHHGVVTGSFVNRNHFAAYAGLALLCQLAVLRRRFFAPLGGASWRETTRRLFSHEGGETWGWLMLAVMTLMALLLAESRGGVVSVACGVWLFTRLVGGKRENREATAGRLLLWLPLLAGLLVSLNPLLERVDQSGSLLREDRLTVFALSLEALRERPWSGVGLGGFAATFATRRPEGMTQVWDRAHNGYLETAMELGLPAALLLLAGLAGLVRLCWRGWRERRGASPFAALAVAAAVQSAIHALTDFSLAIPAVAMTLAALVGLGCAQSLQPPRAGEGLRRSRPVIPLPVGAGPVSGPPAAPPATPPPSAG